MPFTVGSGGASTTAPITVPVEAKVTNTSDITDGVYRAFVAGLNKVFASKRFAVGMRQMIRGIGAEMDKAMSKSGKSIADQITKSLHTVPKAAASAGKQAGHNLASAIPTSLEGAIKRLIGQFDRLEAAVSHVKPNAEFERIIERLNRQISIATTEGARQQTAALNTQLQAQAAATNAAAKQRVAVIQAMSNQIRALERGLGQVIKFSIGLAASAVKGLGAALRGIGQAASAGARASAAALRGITTAVAGVVRGVAHLTAGLASGFARGFSRVSSALRSALSRDEGSLRSSLSRRERMVSASASRQSSLLSRITSPAGLAAISGGAGLGAVLTGGFQRFANLERLQFQFERLLGSEAEAAALLEEISTFARTTSFDLPGVAGLATNFLAMGQAAPEVMGSIQALADVTAFTGGTTESLERIQRALGQIVSTGRLQGDELNQLAENLPGINIRQIIADQLGISTSELVAMQERGELDADTFINAFLTGIQDPKFAGAAQEIASTLSGRLANLRETFDIFGASLVGLVAEPLRRGMEEVTSILDRVAAFISGDMFKPAENPFAGLAPDAEVLIGDLPEEFQRQLDEIGFEGTFVSAADASEWWERMNPPDETLAKLEQIRTMILDFAKGAGGFLAIAGGAKLLFLALRFLVSPLTIITGLFGLLGTMWGKMTRASPKLSSSIKLVRQQFGNLFGTFKETLKLVGGLIGNALFGDSNFFKNLGDRVAGFTNTVGRLVGELNGWLKWANDMIAAGDVGAVIDSISQNVQGFLASILGLTDAQQEAAQALGGNDFGNIFTAFLDKIEEVPVLGPVVAFARRVVDAISDALKQVLPGIGSFFGDIWNIIFGEDVGGTGTQGGLSAMEEQMFGTESEQQSVGTRILDRLEDTFLGPVVRFFRGPFADGVESAIGTVVGFFTEGGFSEMLTNVKSFFTPAVEAVWGALQTAYNTMLPIVDPIVQWVKDIFNAFKENDFSEIDLGNVALGAGVGLLAGAVVAGPIGAIAGAGIGAAFGAGLGDAVAETLGNAWRELILPALASLWSNISTFISTTFTAENLGSAANFLLEFIQKAGEVVGGIATDPIFVGAIAGIAAAGLIVLTFFTLGLVNAITDNIVTWTNLIATGLEDAWEAIAPEFIPDPIRDAISAVLSQPITGLATLGIALGIGIPIISAVIGGITRFGPSLVKGAGGLSGMIFGKGGDKAAGPFDQNARTAFRGVGEKMAGAVIGGFLAFKVGEAAGQAGGMGNLVMALFGGASMGAILGTTIGGPGLGTAIGALLGAGAAGLGAFFGAAGKAAQKAKDETQEYIDALNEISDFSSDAGIQAVQDVFLLNLSDESDEVRQFFEDGKFNARSFVEDTIAGTEDIDDAFARMVEHVIADTGAQLSEGDLAAINEVIAKMHEAQTSGEEFSRQDIGRNATLAFEKIGLSAADVVDSYDVLSDESGEVADAIAEIDKNRAMDQLAGDALSVEDAVVKINDALKAGATAQQIQDMLSAEGAGTEDALKAIEQAGKDVASQMEETKTAIVDALTVSITPVADVEGAALGFVNQFQGIERDLQSITDLHVSGEISEIEVTAANAQVVDDVRSDILGLIQDGLDSGAITNVGDANRLLEQILTNTEAADLSPEATALITSVITELQTALGEGEIPGLFDVLGTQAISQGTLDTMTANLESQITGAVAGADWSTVFSLGSGTPAGEAALGGGVQLGEQVKAGIAVGFSGASLEAAPGSGAGATVTGAAALGTDLVGQVVEAIAAASGDVEDAGGDIAHDFAVGIGSGLSSARVAARNIASATARAFQGFEDDLYRIGFNMSASMARGLDDAKLIAIATAIAIADAIVRAVRATLQISSPSRVFRNIGHDIGEGFMLGIEDSEGDMTSAISSAITDAIEAATNTAEAAAAEAGAAIFSALFPSLIPGGTSMLDLASAQAAINAQIGGFAATLDTSAVGEFGNALASALAAANAEIAIMGRTLAEAFGDITTEVADALAHEQAIEDWVDDMAQLQADFASGALGQAAYREAVAELQTQLNAGLITQDQYNDSLDELNKKLKAGILNQEAYNEALAELGERPEPLSFREVNLIASGADTLNLGTFAGQANAAAINESLSAIEAWATAALEAGVSTTTVANTVDRLVARLRAQAVAAGLSGTAFDRLARAMGLTVAQINAWQTALTSLNANTAAGQANIQMFNEQLSAIRDYGISLLEAGFSAETVRAEMIRLRDELIDQAVAFGFNRRQVQALVAAAGLSNAQLTEFIRQMQAFAEEANNAAAAANAAAEAARRQAEAEAAAADERAVNTANPLGRPVVDTLNVYIPYGDPEAVGMAAANAIAYQSLTSW